MREVEDFGWRDTEGTCAHDYIWPVVLRLLQDHEVRSVLDLGCGNGALTRRLADAGFDVMGCDADKAGVALARQGEGRFEELGVYDDPKLLGRADFDAVISVEVVEHLFSPAHLPRFAREVLRPGGLLIVTTPYHGYLKNLALSLVNGWDRHFHPLRDGGHIKFFSRGTLEKLVAAEGFEVEEFAGVGRAPFLWKSLVVAALAV